MLIVVLIWLGFRVRVQGCHSACGPPLGVSSSRKALIVHP